MASLEPSIINVPVFHTDVYTLLASTVTTLATKISPAASTSIASTLADSLAALPTSIGFPPLSSAFEAALVTGILPLPSAFEAPLATGIPPLPPASGSPLAVGKTHTPPIALVALLVITLSALIVFLGLCFIIFLRCRRRRSKWPHTKHELDKHNNDSPKHVSRPRVYDLKQGSPPDPQANDYKMRQRAESLARLEGLTPESTQEHRAPKRLRHSQTRRADSAVPREATIDEESADWEMQHKQAQIHVPQPVRKSTPAHLRAPASRDEHAPPFDPALCNPDFSGMYEDCERARKMEEIVVWLSAADDPHTRGSVVARAAARASAKTVGLHARVAEKKAAAAPRRDGGSRFKERFSLATQSYHGSI
ncbi:uncharacterized protein M421DRAFT_95080 [Didymella exigua CBS 183.55]|uniref:Uncharacterized protein n=1 Tax=Didymella exigua CBS 183.55 TaxID=1150837 RepID=A0A6A5RCX0_9PLEO|nr:uncharacterized protein M421DRAFT_95080 [Didymella exigua CBS 183.55]KAF1924934.1 hypothetical protein M421DRAFT_95080 [Didymella exigua CBS 183.55]